MKRTAEEKRAWRERMDTLVRKIKGMTDDERESLAARMPIVTCEGYALSTFNQCFLIAQTKIAVTVVGGFRQWQRAGRVVRKGEHAVGTIFVPMFASKQADVGEQDEDGLLRGFTFASMFDVSQTDAAGSTEAAK